MPTGAKRNDDDDLNVQLVKHDIVTTVIYFYITTEFHYVKCGSAYGGVIHVYGENVINFVIPALHVTKTCYISLTNSHSFLLQTNETFVWESVSFEK